MCRLRFRYEERLPRARRCVLYAIVAASAAAGSFAGLPAVARAQTPAQTAQAAPAAIPAFDNTLQPALEQVGLSLRQIQIDRWKMSRQWKAQFQNDANSIQQDLSVQLPGLLNKAQASPADMGPRVEVLRNVNALYDVLVRVATAANLAGGKADAAALDNARQQLELARKSASDNLLKAATLQDQEIVQLRTRLQTVRTEEAPSDSPRKIIVNNGVAQKTARHRKVSHGKSRQNHVAPKRAEKPSPTAPATTSGNKPNPPE